MVALDISTVDALYLVKWVLGSLVVLCALAITIACVLDVRERRRWRAMVPDGWPPPGTLHDEACHRHEREVMS